MIAFPLLKNQSTAIKDFDYDADKQILRVVFGNGSVYKYSEVPESIYKEMKETSSIGQYFNSQVRDKFGFDRQVK